MRVRSRAYLFCKVQQLRTSCLDLMGQESNGNTTKNYSGIQNIANIVLKVKSFLIGRKENEK